MYVCRCVCNYVCTYVCIYIYIYIYIRMYVCVCVCICVCEISRPPFSLDFATLVAQDTLPSQRKAHLNFRATLVSQLSELVHELL